MSHENADINFQGPSGEYRPPQGRVPKDTSTYTSPNVGMGFADVDGLLADLETFKANLEVFYRNALNEMKSYTVLIDKANQELVRSHQMSYPNDDTPDSISFAEYIYNFSNSRATSSSYVNKYYEAKVRGPHGTNALDIAHVVMMTHSEVVRIQDFLEKYTGDIDEPSEFRIIELFQTWTQNSQGTIERFWQAFQAKAVAEIPEAEVAQLDEGKSREFQALFQSKLNIINRSISDIIGQLYKNWDEPSERFYNRVLGPSLSYNLKIGKKISQGVSTDTMPTLAQEANMTSFNFDSKLKTAMEDQLKRNRLFDTLTGNILNNIVQRDVYVRYLRQLSNKGKTIPNFFITQVFEEPEVIKTGSVNLVPKRKPTYETNASSDHSYITGVEDDGAHPQYLLRTGDKVEGTFEIDGSFYLNDADVSEMIYVKDGGPVVGSNYIDWENVGSADVRQAGDNYIPMNLEIADAEVLSDGKVRYTLSFEVESDNLSNYEFEIIEL